MTRFCHCCFFAFLFLVNLQPLAAEEWTIPLAGNAYRSAPAPGGRGFRRDQVVAWEDQREIYSLFFHVDRAARLNLALVAGSREDATTLVTRVGDHSFRSEFQGSELSSKDLGAIDVAQSGYVRVDFQLDAQAPAAGIQVRELVVNSDTQDLRLSFVGTNEGNMFYWGRRGPSVHLTYEVPKDTDLQYAYCEITVPEGQDIEGSYFMANGFAEGYFGFQVNGPEERRVLFSVWSPFRTDNPREIPEDQRVNMLAKGPEVHVGEFGNEGSGGQSFLVYPWQAGETYRFLTEVQPDGQGNTIYTSWFGSKAKDEWRLIASFRRPQTDTHLRGFHSFLENFNPTTGHLERSGRYANVWVRDVAGEWHECTQARFSVDATGRGGHRLDFSGGAQGSFFYLRNCGFFGESEEPGTIFTRDSTRSEPPQLLPTKLPRP